MQETENRIVTGAGTDTQGEAGSGWRRGDLEPWQRAQPPVPFSSPEGGQDQNLPAATKGNFKDTAPNPDSFHQRFSKIPRGPQTSVFAHREKHRGHFLSHNL